MAPDDPEDHDSRRTRPLRAISAPPIAGARAALLEQLRDLRDRHGAVVPADLDQCSDEELRDLIANVLERVAGKSIA